MKQNPQSDRHRHGPRQSQIDEPVHPVVDIVVNWEEYVGDFEEMVLLSAPIHGIHCCPLRFRGPKDAQRLMIKSICIHRSVFVRVFVLFLDLSIHTLRFCQSAVGFSESQDTKQTIPTTHRQKSSRTTQNPKMAI